MLKKLILYTLSSLFLWTQQFVYGADDLEAPVINSISLDQSSIDVTSGSKTLTATINYTDESGADCSSLYLTFSPPGEGGNIKYFWRTR